LWAQRIIGIALGYEDIEDHDDLRTPPWIKLTATAKTKHSPIPERLAEPFTKIRTSAAMAQAIHQNLFCPGTTWKTGSQIASSTCADDPTSPARAAQQSSFTPVRSGFQSTC
jgi:hypothetical protein